MVPNSPTRRAVLYGNTIFLAGLAVQYSHRPGMEIVTIDADQKYAEQQLDASAPNVIVFDLTADQPYSAIHLLKKNPSLVLVGVDATNDQVLVLSGQTSAVSTTEDLLKVINGE